VEVGCGVLLFGPLVVVVEMVVVMIASDSCKTPLFVC
jgi:hypothetical protein